MIGQIKQTFLDLMQQKLFRKKQEIFGGCLKLNIKIIDGNSIEFKGKNINLFFIFTKSCI